MSTKIINIRSALTDAAFFAAVCKKKKICLKMTQSFCYVVVRI